MTPFQANAKSDSKVSDSCNCPSNCCFPFKKRHLSDCDEIVQELAAERLNELKTEREKSEGN